MKKVVVTGVGMVTALGNDVETTWRKMLEGMSGVSEIHLFDAENTETKFAAQVSDDFEEKLKDLFKIRQRSKMTRATKMMMVATDEAVRDSGYDFKNMSDPTKSACIIGSVTAGVSEEEQEKLHTHFIVKTMINASCAWNAIRYGIQGPVFSVATACASSAYAINLAQNMIRAGIIDVAIVGGTDTSINPDYIRGFNQILAMSTNNSNYQKASCPFSKNRDGFVMGEGAGVIILESEESAIHRNATIYAELAGSAVTCEADDITAPTCDGIGMALTMQKALEDAKIDPKEVDYINAHGTSTYLNDKYETMAIKSLLGARCYEVPVSSCKSMIGHTIAACGAIEAIITIKSISENLIVPTINYEEPDEELDLDYVPNVSRRHDVHVALSNSFGFGGHNATLVFREYK